MNLRRAAIAGVLLVASCVGNGDSGGAGRPDNPCAAELPRWRTLATFPIEARDGERRPNEIKVSEAFAVKDRPIRVRAEKLGRVRLERAGLIRVGGTPGKIIGNVGLSGVTSGSGSIQGCETMGTLRAGEYQLTVRYSVEGAGRLSVVAEEFIGPLGA